MENNFVVNYEFSKGDCDHFQTIKEKFQTYFPDTFYDKFLLV